MKKMMIREVTNSEDFKQIINTQAVVMFGAGWCLPCTKFKPIFVKIAKVETTKNFYYIDVEKAEKIVEKENIVSVPAVHIYEKGKLTAKLTEYTQISLENLLKNLNNA